MISSITFPRRLCRLVGVAFFALASVCACAQSLSDAELERIGKRIWQNESAGSYDGLTAWNSGEDFASLGIGHFIWYPAGQQGPFEESFPALLAYLQQSGVQLPQWLAQAKDCPWPNRTAFYKDSNGPRQTELRKLLASTVKEQTQFIIARLSASEGKLMRAAGKDARRVADNIDLLRQTASGNFAMIDYVNFKGDGTDPKESYRGEGWGLLQVLKSMQAADSKSAPKAFAEAASQVLARRVQNSPPERKEQRWLDGWQNRCRTYARPF